MNSPRSQPTRARIAAAAFELLREGGTAGLTMRQVAARTGLALSNVQYHYPSREALLIGVTEHHLAACREAMRTAIGPADRASLRSVLRAALCDERVVQTAPPFRELFAWAQTEPGVRDQLNEHYERSFEALVELLGAHGSKRRKRIEETATVLMTSIEGAYLLDDITPVRGKRLANVLEQLAAAMLEDT